MSEKKITKKERFLAMLTKYNFDDNDRAVIEHEIELLDKRAAAPRGMTKAQKENAELADKLVATMEPNVRYTITDLCRIMEIKSNQKMTHLVTPLVKESGVVKREVDKRVAYFSLA